MAPLHRLQRSAVTNYISNLLRAIDTVRSDPAQLRNLVYELARMRVSQTTASHLNAEADIGEQLRLLDMAIHRVEILSRLDDEISDSIPPTLADRAMSSAQPRDPSINVNSFPSTRESELYDAPVDLDKQPNIQPLSIYEEGRSSLHDRLSLSTYFRPIQIWNVETGQEGSLLRSRRGENVLDCGVIGNGRKRRADGVSDYLHAADRLWEWIVAPCGSNPGGIIAGKDIDI